MIPRIEEQIDRMTDVITDNLWKLIELTKPITNKHLEDHEGPWPISEQYLKIHEETSEASKAYYRNLPNKTEEHLDIFFATLTTYHRQNFKKPELREAVKDVLTKFHERGWLF